MNKGQVRREGLDSGRGFPYGRNLRKSFSHCSCFFSYIGKRVKQDEEVWNRLLDEYVNGPGTGGKPTGQPSESTLV